MSKQQLQRILPFSLLVLGWSFVYFVLRPFSTAEMHHSPTPLKGIELQLTTLKYLMIAWVPAIGLLIGGMIFRRYLPSNPIRKISLFGGNAKWSLLIAITPIICLTAFGVPNTFGFQTNVFGFILGMIVLVYAFLEEYGWRGYLNEEIQTSNEWLKYGIIGFVWFVWHWDFLQGDTNIVKNLGMCFGLIGASAGIGQIADKTKSIVVCAAVHALGNIGLMFGLVTQNVSLQNRLIIIGICIGVWVWIFKIWDREKVIVGG